MKKQVKFSKQLIEMVKKGQVTEAKCLDLVTPVWQLLLLKALFDIHWLSYSHLNVYLNILKRDFSQGTKK